MKNEKKIMVSVIVPTYNSEDYIKETLESVLSQSYKEIEVIVVDDGSTDGTKKILSKYIQENKIKYEYQRNRGVSSARNIGIKKSSGDFIAFIDSDDIWMKEKIKKQVEFLENNKDISLVLTDCEVVDEKLNHKYYHKNKLSDTRVGKIKQIFYGEISMVTPSILFRKDILKRISGFNEKLKHREDNLFLMEVLQNFDIAILNETLYKRRVREESLSRENRSEVLIDSHEQFMSLVRKKFPYLEFKREYSRLYYSLGVISKKRKNKLNYLLKSLAYNKLNYKSYVVLLISLLPFEINLTKIRDGLK